MPTWQQHLQQAKHNEAFLASLDLETTPFLDWAITAVFYAALHYLRALMARHAYTTVSTYGDMDKAFERLSVLKRNQEIYEAYRQLKDDSRSARYNMWKPTKETVEDLRDGELRRIREFVLVNLER